jgi:nitrilase
MAPTIVAAVQATPVFLDREGTVAKASRLIAEAAAHGARIVVLPEAFVPTYPDWVWRARPWEDGNVWYGRLLEQAVEIPSPATDALGAAAREAGAYVFVGVNERARGTATLFNTLLAFGPDGSLALRHRKIMPTGAERMVWSQGDGSGLRVLDTPYGRIGGLVCWENYMPLARYSLYSQGMEVLVAPTWDRGDVWISSLRHIAKEGRTYVVGVTPVLRGSDVPAGIPGRDVLYGGEDDWMCPGDSAIVGPSGELLAGPLRGEEGILYAEIDDAVARASRHEFDPVGHYARSDLFHLTVGDTVRRAMDLAAGAVPRQEHSMDDFFEQAAAAVARTGPGNEAFAAVGDLLRGLAAKADLVAPEATRAGLRTLHGSGAASTILGEGADGSVLMLARFPSDAPTPVHNHNSWGVVCVLEGRDRYLSWRRLDDGSDPGHARVELAEERELGPLDVVWFDPPPQDIHSQQGIGGDVWELVYFGANPNLAPRAYFEPDTGTVTYANAT